MLFTASSKSSPIHSAVLVVPPERSDKPDGPRQNVGTLVYSCRVTVADTVLVPLMSVDVVIGSLVTTAGAVKVVRVVLVSYA